MPRRIGKVPSYCLHRPSGQAVVYLNRRPIYLGSYGSDESQERYEREIARWRIQRSTGGQALPQFSATAHPALSVAEIILAYLRHAQVYYVDSAGQQTKEFVEMKIALRPLRKVHGNTLVADFGPRALKEVRQFMVECGRLSRPVINRRVNRIRRVFKWAVSEQLAPQGTYEALRAVDPLKRGRTTAKETKGVKPVSKECVDLVVAAAHPQIAAMIQLQLLGGMRPQEVTRLRTADIDMSSDVWLYVPADHKNKWRGKDRSPIFLGPRAQSILRPFLERPKEEFLFSPLEAERERNTLRKALRQSPMTPSQRKRRPKKSPLRAKRQRYDTDSYRRAITYTIQRINRDRKKQELPVIPYWCPLQLRHNRGTELRRSYGIEAAQVFLGHEHADVTQVYAERDLEVGLRIAREIG
jgi:integrase